MICGHTKTETSDDYAKAAVHIPYSFTVELPDRGQYGFLLPANQILTVGRELWATAGVVCSALLSDQY